MKDIKQAQLMLILSRRDLKAVQNMTDTERFDDAIFGFHAQQTVEKALKAWLSFRGLFYHKTHDLRVLFLLIEETDKGQTKQFFDLVDLMDFAVEYRYDIFDDEPIERDKILAEVMALVEFVDKLIHKREDKV